MRRSFLRFTNWSGGDGLNVLLSTGAHGGAERRKRARLSQPLEGAGHRIDVATAIEQHPQAKKLLADQAATPGLRRAMVKTAAIMGFPVER